MAIPASLLDAFRAVGEDLFAHRLIGGAAGNLSARTPDGLWITRSGARKHRLTEADLLLVPIEPDPARDRGASVELMLHRAVYRSTDAGAVVHAHPRTAVALSLVLERIVPLDLEGRFYLGEVPVLTPASVSASPEAAAAIEAAIPEHPVVLLRGHGAFAQGRDLYEAYARMSALEESAEVLLKKRLWEGA